MNIHVIRNPVNPNNPFVDLLGTPIVKVRPVVWSSYLIGVPEPRLSLPQPRLGLPEPRLPVP